MEVVGNSIGSRQWACSSSPHFLSSPRSVPMNALSRVGALTFLIALAHAAAASESPCEACLQQTSPPQTCVAEESAPSWIFRRSTYTHDPETGARVAQYMRIRPVEPLEDERNVTSRYSRS